MSSVAERIIKDAEAAVKQIEHNLKEREKELVQQHELQQKEASLRMESELAVMLEQETARLTALGELDLKKQVLKEKTDLYHSVIDDARERIKKDASLYQKFLQRMAVKGAVTGKEEVILSQDDAKSQGKDLVAEANKALTKEKKIKGALALSKEHRETGGGLILKEGPVEFNATLEEAVSISADENRVELGTILFSEDKKTATGAA